MFQSEFGVLFVLNFIDGVEIEHFSILPKLIAWLCHCECNLSVNAYTVLFEISCMSFQIKHRLEWKYEPWTWLWCGG